MPIYLFSHCLLFQMANGNKFPVCLFHALLTRIAPSNATRSPYRNAAHGRSAPRQPHADGRSAPTFRGLQTSLARAESWSYTPSAGGTRRSATGIPWIQRVAHDAPLRGVIGTAGEENLRAPTVGVCRHARFGRYHLANPSSYSHPRAQLFLSTCLIHDCGCLLPYFLL